MKSIFLALTLSAAVHAAEQPILQLWPAGVPEKPGVQIGPEEEIKRPKDDGIRRLTNVTNPTLTIYRPEKANGTAVVVCPGGGYSILAIEHEGTKVCEYLNSIGVTAVLLKYRVPKRDPLDPSREPLQDAQRAIGMLRKRAAEFGIRPDRIGILGFSAGGHLAVMAALHANERTYAFDATVEAEDATPNFCVPVYPAYLVSKEDTFTLLPEVKVTDASPPMCLIHAHDDKGVTSSSSSVLLYLEYKKRGLPCELHVYAHGGHGFGLKPSPLPTANWLVRVGEWMGAMKWLE